MSIRYRLLPLPLSKSVEAVVRDDMNHCSALDVEKGELCIQACNAPGLYDRIEVPILSRGCPDLSSSNRSNPLQRKSYRYLVTAGELKCRQSVKEAAMRVRDQLL